MLIEMRVENFALMKEVIIHFKNGFTVFTGETGAGKSMLIDALGVLLGGRASTDYIRYGTNQARVEGIFIDVPDAVNKRLVDAGYEIEDGQLILFREINNSGRNLCRVQGRTVPLSLYRTFCEGLVDIHGQMEHQSLLKEDTHLSLLDAFGGQDNLLKVEQVAEAAKNYIILLKKEQELLKSQGERQRKEDLLNYQIQEIERINPLKGEEDQLNQEKQILMNGERIITLINDSYTALYEGSGRQSAVYDLMGQIFKNWQELSRLDTNCSEIASQMESIYYQLEDVSSLVRDYREKFEFEPERLDQIEERLVDLGRLKKYGITIDDVLNLKAQMQEEITLLASLEENLKNIKERKDSTLKDFNDKAQLLSQERRTLAKKLEEGMEKELKDLGFNKSQFKVQFTSVENPNVNGIEKIEFYFSANSGEPLKPLAKVASGGEMSRLMLALKSLFANVEKVPTFIFDEVDSGVGGTTIQKVGEKLGYIAETKQVICITHSPMVAAQAHLHYGIVKNTVEERTKTIVKILSENERVQELARMLGGKGEIAIKHAEELWRNRVLT